MIYNTCINIELGWPQAPISGRIRFAHLPLSVWNWFYVHIVHISHSISYHVDESLYTPRLANELINVKIVQIVFN